MSIKSYFTLTNIVKFSKIGSISLVILVIAFLILDNIVMPIYVRHGEEIEMPDVTVLEFLDAIGILNDYGFEVRKTSQYDSYREKGVVIEQNPEPFKIVKKGRIVYLTVSLGEKLVKVPELRGISERDAEIRLQENNLKLGTKYYEPSNDPEGTVIKQLYETDMTIPKGSSVSITVSLGTPPDEIFMPDVINKNVKDASDMIHKRGLAVGEFEYQVQNNLLPNTVIDQIPPMGSVLALGDTVYFIISRIDSSSSKR